MDLDTYRVDAGTVVNLEEHDPGDTGDIESRAAARKILKKNRKEIVKLQKRLSAEGTQSLLVVFQAMDTGGKDGCIENVFKGVNPAGVKVWSFKVPTATEAAHDFLWRYHGRTPAVGEIGVFNRSHYEDVLVVRVKNLVPEQVWSRRYDQINGFESVLETRGTHILKFYLHISKDEQKRRIESRLENPDKRWKYSSADLAERAYWDDYQNAFEAALSQCSTPYAPWYVVPANNKWFRDAVVSSVILDKLREMAPKYPEPQEDLDGIVVSD